MSNKELILEEFKRKQGLYNDFTTSLKNLIKKILADDEVCIHSVTSRTKGIESLAEKISRPNKVYQKLKDIKDLSGVRIITYFADDVDKVAELIEKEFEIDQKNSIDKRKEWDYAEFGYSSLHKVGKLNQSKVALEDYSKFRGLFFEIQIRSILQHAWAEIEHDLGYKNEEGIPDAIKRRFAKLAALLELGDDEFVRLRDDLDSYGSKVEREIKYTPEATCINKVSLQKFINSNQVMEDLKVFFTDWFGKGLKPDKDSYWLKSLPREFHYIGVNNIKELGDLLKEYSQSIKKCIDLVYTREEPYWAPSMILFALLLLVIATRYSKEKAWEVFEGLSIGPRYDFVTEVKKRIR
jgi:ppGpp synthetase/RelA/SpoT-type nucleotidyltranferase